MKCETFVQELARWMELSWEEDDPALAPEMEEHVEHCSECAVTAKAALALVTPPPVIVRTPESLPARVMERVLADSEPRGERVLALEGQLRRSRRRTAWVAAAAAILAIATSAMAFMRSQSGTQVEVHLVLEAPTAQTVSVVGDWNGWQTGSQQLIDHDGDGEWEVTIKVERGGEYRYQFVVDEERWINDPAARMQVQDGFGGTNSVLDI